MNNPYNNKKYLKSILGELKNMLRGNTTDRVYLHFGGKLSGDEHTSRVLHGYDPNIKLKLIKKISSKSDIVFCVAADDLNRGRIRGDNGLNYTQETIRAITELQSKKIYVNHLVIVGDNPKPPYKEIEKFINNNPKKPIALTYWNLNKPNKRIIFKKNIVAVISPGSNSGKFEFCSQQALLDTQAGLKVNYKRIHTFPLFELHPWHPLNLAYFAASADAFNHNDIFQVKNVKDINKAWEFFKRDENIYMNASIFSGIEDWESAEKDSAAEIKRRFIRYREEVKNNQERPEVLEFVRKLII